MNCICIYNYFFVAKVPQIKPIKIIIKKIKPISSTDLSISVSQIIVIEPIQIIETVALLLQQPQLEPIIENNNTISPQNSPCDSFISSSPSNSPTPSPTYTYPFSIINHKNHKKYVPARLEIIHTIKCKITQFCNHHKRTKKPSIKLILRLSNENRFTIPIITYLEELNSFRNESLTYSIDDRNERHLEKILNKIFEEIYDDYENNPEPVSPL